MRRIVLAALLLGSAVAVTPAANAQSGFLCRFASITDPTLENDTQAGEIGGGPLFSTDVGEEGANISIRCTIQVGAQGETHAGVDAYTAVSPTTPGVAVLADHQFTYVAPPGSPVYLCTEARINDGPPRYFDETGDDATRDWSASSSAKCALAISQEVGGGGPDPGLGVDAVVIVGLPAGLEPIHLNVDGLDCSSYTWDGTNYEVTCTGGTPPRACAPPLAVAIGAITTTARCLGGAAAVAVGPVGVTQGTPGTLPLTCKIVGVGLGLCVG